MSLTLTQDADTGDITLTDVDDETITVTDVDTTITITSD